MNDFNKTFFKQLFEETFGEYVSELTSNLKKKDSEYCSLIKERRNITEKNKKISHIFNDAKVKDVTKLFPKDVAKLNEYFDIINEIHYKEEQEIFLAGASSCYLALKKLGLLK